jgi:anthranilate synthase component 2
MILMIDNYDSFTFNLVQYLGELGVTVTVYRNDELTLQDIEKLKPAGIVISPGPCTPNEAGISMQVIKEFGKEIPLLGVCLGHQSIGQVFGGKVVRAKQVMHGKLSQIHHQQQGVFAKLPSPFSATRYHSLVVEKETLPDCLEITAWTVSADNGMDEIMGLKHKEYLLEGVQFHPESILTEHGKLLLQNFLESIYGTKKSST